MTRKLWVVAAALVVTIACVAVAVKWTKTYLLMGQQASQPNRTPEFATFVRRADGLLLQGGIQPSKNDRTESVEAYGLTPDEAWHECVRILHRGSVVLVRCQERGFTDRNSKRVMVWALVDRPEKSRASAPQLQVGAAIYGLSTTDAGEKRRWFCPQLASRSIVQDPVDGLVRRNASGTSARVWQRIPTNGTDVAPVIAPAPMLEADYYKDGNWQATVAFFESEAESSGASLTFVPHRDRE